MTDTLVTYHKLWNIDSKGKTRIWYMQTQGGKHRTISGLFDGKQVTSGWVTVEGKNIGKSNETTPSEQALREMEADYVLKLKKKYYQTYEEAKAAGSGMKFFSPMLATKWKDVHGKIVYPVFTQPKLDGIRASFSEEDGALSRGGEPFQTVAHITEALSECFGTFPGLRLDGELYNHDLREDFNEIASIITQKKPTPDDIAKAEKMAEYHVYDCPSHPGTFLERFLFLKNQVFSVLEGQSKIKLVYTKRVENLDELDEEYAVLLSEKYEGQMIRTDDVYLNGPKRDKRLVKRKEFMDEEYPVLRIEEGRGNWAGAAKRAVLLLPDQRTFEAGINGTYERNKALLERARLGDVPKFATVRYPNLTPDGIPRFGIAVEFFGAEGRKH